MFPLRRRTDASETLSDGFRSQRGRSADNFEVVEYISNDCVTFFIGRSSPLGDPRSRFIAFLLLLRTRSGSRQCPGMQIDRHTAEVGTADLTVQRDEQSMKKKVSHSTWTNTCHEKNCYKHRWNMYEISSCDSSPTREQFPEIARYSCIVRTGLKMYTANMIVSKRKKKITLYNCHCASLKTGASLHGEERSWNEIKRFYNCWNILARYRTSPFRSSSISSGWISLHAGRTSSPLAGRIYARRCDRSRGTLL